MPKKKTTQQIESKIPLVHITPKEFQSTIDTNQLCIIDFYADWCNPCKSQSRLFELNGDQLTNRFPTLKIFKMDTETDGGISDELKIESIPCLVIYYKGIYKKMGEGGKKIDAVLAAIQLWMDEVNTKMLTDSTFISSLVSQQRLKCLP